MYTIMERFPHWMLWYHRECDVMCQNPNPSQKRSAGSLMLLAPWHTNKKMPCRPRDSALVSLALRMTCFGSLRGLEVHGLDLVPS